MKHSRAFVIICCVLLGLAGCSRDITFIDDYKLYDMDGSNRTIMGHGGGVAISNVTAWAMENRLIFVEVGGEYLPNREKQASFYKLIDSSRHSIIDLPASTGPPDRCRRN